MLLIIIGGIALTLVVANLNSIARTGIVKVLSYVLGVNVSLEKVKISLLRGTCSLRNLVIGNPKGFKTPNAFSVGEINVALNIKSFFTDEPNIKLVSIKNPHITIERGRDDFNFTKIISNASRFQNKQKEKPQTAGEKKIEIDKILVQNAKISLSASIFHGQTISFSIPRIEMRDIGGQKKSVSIAESIRMFFTKILTSALDAGKGIIPEDVYKSLNTSLKTVRNIVNNAHLIKETINGGADTVLHQLNKAKTQLKEPQKQLKEGEKQLRKDMKGLSRGIKDIFKKDK